ncbi:MAG: methyltransferase domain-containing protein [Armatimonas sp.]
MQESSSAYRTTMPGDTILASRLNLPAYTRSAAYNPRWVLENLMGPNPLWLAEALVQHMDLKPGMRVLDMGCGKAITSIFLAQEFGVEVWATDLWVPPTENWGRIQQTEVSGRVFPIYAEAHALPFAEEFFDALVSMDAYHYFGTSDLYLSSYSRLVKPGGQIGIIVPGLATEFTDHLPEHIAPYWQSDFWSFHSPTWWRNHWQRSGRVEVELADLLPEGWRHWLLWNEVCLEYGFTPEQFQEWVIKEAEMLRTDAGRNLGFTRVVAHRK